MVNKDTNRDTIQKYESQNSTDTSPLDKSYIRAERTKSLNPYALIFITSHKNQHVAFLNSIQLDIALNNEYLARFYQLSGTHFHG